MKYTKKHCEAVGARIMEYDKALASDEFVRMDLCNVCETSNSIGCIDCLFFSAEQENVDRPYINCICGPDRKVGIACKTKSQQRRQRDFLLSLVEKNGYEIVEVDG